MIALICPLYYLSQIVLPPHGPHQLARIGADASDMSHAQIDSQSWRKMPYPHIGSQGTCKVQQASDAVLPISLLGITLVLGPPR